MIASFGVPERLAMVRLLLRGSGRRASGLVSDRAIFSIRSLD